MKTRSPVVNRIGETGGWRRNELKSESLASRYKAQEPIVLIHKEKFKRTDCLPKIVQPYDVWSFRKGASRICWGNEFLLLFIIPRIRNVLKLINKLIYKK